LNSPAAHPNFEAAGVGAIQAAAQTINTVEAIDQELIKARKISQLNNAKTDLLGGMMDFESSLAGRTDYENFLPEYEKFVEDRKKQYDREITDREVSDAFNAEFDRQVIQNRLKIRQAVRKQIVDVARGDFTRNYETYSKAVTLSTGMARDDALNQGHLLIAENVRAGIITRQEGAKQLNDINEAYRKAQVHDQTVEAMADLRRDPAGFNAAAYPLIDDKVKIQLNDLALKRVEHNAKEAVRKADKLERATEKAHKKEIEDNDFAAWQKYRKGDMTLNDLENLATNRKISEEAYNSIYEKMDPNAEKVKNDPVTVGEINDKLNLGMNVRPLLTSALHDRKINTGTYITMMGQVGNKEFKRGSDYITMALAPTQADRWSPDKGPRYAEAMDRYFILIGRGVNAVTAGRDVVDSYLVGMKRTFRGLRRPIYLSDSQMQGGTGDRKSKADLDLARTLTVQAYQMGAISDDVYKEEINLIDQLEKLSSEITQIEVEVSDDEKRRIQ